uniref:Uncharacterized protein n=1 Tax=Arundo donax TaxID=35708 RepID=A0A0A9AJB3_ARUDO
MAGLPVLGEPQALGSLPMSRICVVLAVSSRRN